MTIGPIDWGAHDPDLVEQVLSVMLLQERPQAWRRERSRGDAGVDVADRVEGGFEVIQIKSFAGSLTSRRKSDIEKSFESALAGGELNGPIVSWQLLLPMDQSKEAEKWFDALTANAPFKCSWEGRSRVNLLASNNPHVVDYYLRDGRARIEERFRDLLVIREIVDSTNVGLRPVEIVEGLRHLLEALNRDDPNYRYAFEVSHERPPAESEQARPGLVMARTECVADRGCVTIRVFARHRHAIEERPITVSFGVEPGSDAHTQLQRTFEFGATTDLPDGSVSALRVSAPGGLSSSSDVAALRVSAYAEANFVPFRLLLEVRDESGGVLARTPAAVVRRLAGTRGKQLDCVEVGGSFTVQMQIADPEIEDSPISMSFGSLDFWGKPAATVHDGVELLSVMRKPNSLVVLLEAGDRHLMTLGLQDTEPFVDHRVADFVRDLSALQTHVPVPLLVPMTITAGDARRAHEAAQLTAGTIVDGDWHDAQMVVDAETVDDFLNRLDMNEGFSARLPYRLRVGSQDIDLGHYILRLGSASAADAQAARDAARRASAPGDLVTIALVPGEDRCFEMLWVTDDPVGS